MIIASWSTLSLWLLITVSNSDWILSKSKCKKTLFKGTLDVEKKSWIKYAHPIFRYLEGIKFISYKLANILFASLNSFSISSISLLSSGNCFWYASSLSLTKSSNCSIIGLIWEKTSIWSPLQVTIASSDQKVESRLTIA